MCFFTHSKHFSKTHSVHFKPFWDNYISVFIIYGKYFFFFTIIKFLIGESLKMIVHNIHKKDLIIKHNYRCVKNLFLFFCLVVLLSFYLNSLSPTLMIAYSSAWSEWIKRSELIKNKQTNKKHVFQVAIMCVWVRAGWWCGWVGLLMKYIWRSLDVGLPYLWVNLTQT